jgi:hypothetical protein
VHLILYAIPREFDRCQFFLKKEGITGNFESVLRSGKIKADLITIAAILATI